MDVFDLMERDYDRLFGAMRDLLEGRTGTRRSAVRDALLRELAAHLDGLEREVLPLLRHESSLDALVSLTEGGIPRLRGLLARLERGEDSREIYDELGGLLLEQCRRAHRRLHPKARQTISPQIAMRSGQALLRRREATLGHP